MKTKKLLNEWRSFLSENRVYSKNEIIQIIRKKRSEKDVAIFDDFWNNNRFITKYTQVIKKELETTAEPIKEILETCRIHYYKVYQSAGPRETNAIGSGSVSIDDLRKAIDLKKGFSKNEVRQQCSYVDGRPVVGKYNDFNIFHSSNDWIIIEPKSIEGSIAWAHGKPDGTEETDQSRRVGWCTGVSTGNNMFPNYAGNLHMFYFIKSDYENVQGPERRLCVSYINKKGKAKISDDESASVDANNTPISKKYLNRHIDKSILSKIENLVSARKETNFSEIYSKITLSQLLRQISQMKRHNIPEDQVNKTLYSYASNAKDKSVISYILENSNEGIPGIERREAIAGNKNLAEIDTEGDIVRRLASDKAWIVRLAIAEREDLLKLDPRGEIIEKLKNDENSQVRSGISQRVDLLKSTDNISNIAEKIKKMSSLDRGVLLTYGKKSLELDPTGKIVLHFINDEDSSVRGSIAQRKDLLKIDPSGDVIRQLASDKSVYVRSSIAGRKDLLKADPSGDVIRQLASDEYDIIRNSIINNIKYNKKLNESFLKQYIKLIVS